MKVRSCNIPCSSRHPSSSHQLARTAALLALLSASPSPAGKPHSGSPEGRDNTHAQPASHSAGLSAERDRLEVEKLRAEIANLQHQNQNKDQFESEKLALEIQQLKHWWLEPSFFQAIFGSLVALGALLTGYYNGWFEVQRGKLELANAKLEDKRSELNEKISSLGAERELLKAKVSDLEQKQIELNPQVTDLANLGAQLASGLDTVLTKVRREQETRVQAFLALEEQRRRLDQLLAESLDLNRRAANADPRLQGEVSSLDERSDSVLRENPWEHVEPTPGTSFYNEFDRPIFDYDPNISAAALFKANATPAMLDMYEQASPEEKRSFEVQSVLNHLKTVNKAATNLINWDKEKLLATARAIA